MSAAIHFFTPEIDFQVAHEEAVKAWIKALTKQHRHAIQELNFIFVSDAHLLEMNNQHLQHDYYTDILTFAYEGNPIQGDIYISVDRVKDNADKLNSSFDDELHRVMAHGILHIIGYDDHEESDIKQMREAEDDALSSRDFIS
jgi:rRNA maturation RNase YbeY